MKVSVIISAYNIESYIGRCLKSVIKQTLTDIEIIIVNDGSIDNTLNVINKFINKDNSIKIINQNNKGLIEARKAGLKIANGKYILFVDGDDWIEEECLKKLYDNAEDNNSDIVLYNAFYSYDDRKRELDTFKDIDLKKNDFLDDLFLGNIKPSIWSKFIKKEFLTLKNIKFPDHISYAEDLATVSNIFMNSPRVSFCKERLYNYYQRANSITKVCDGKIIEIDKAIEFIKIKLKENKLYELYEKQFEYLIYMHMFISKVIMVKEKNEINKCIYKQYKEKNINSIRNKYITEYINKQNRNSKIRIRLYDINYYSGIIFDFNRKVLNSIFVK